MRSGEVLTKLVLRPAFGLLVASGSGNGQALRTIFSHFVETDITAVPEASLGHAALLALSQDCSRSRATCISCSPRLCLTAGGQMRAKLKRAVRSGTMESDTCLLLQLSSVTLGRSLMSRSLSGPLEMKLVGQTFFNRHACTCL